MKKKLLIRIASATLIFSGILLGYTLFLRLRPHDLSAFITPKSEVNLYQLFTPTQHLLETWDAIPSSDLTKTIPAWDEAISQGKILYQNQLELQNQKLDLQDHLTLLNFQHDLLVTEIQDYRVDISQTYLAPIKNIEKYLTGLNPLDFDTTLYTLGTTVIQLGKDAINEHLQHPATKSAHEKIQQVNEHLNYLSANYPVHRLRDIGQQLLNHGFSETHLLLQLQALQETLLTFEEHHLLLQAPEARSFHRAVLQQVATSEAIKQTDERLHEIELKRSSLITEIREFLE